ncbi:MAG: cyclic nucleotide-binding domain-containing protein [Magnetovibrionaceae bacterium]
MDIGEIAKVLRTNPLFSKVDPAKLKLIAFASEMESYDDGEVVFREGDTGDAAYLIIEGTAAIVVEQASCGEAVIGTLGKDEMVGEMAIFRASPRAATIRAQGPLNMLRVEGDVFLDVVTGDADAALGVMRVLSDKIARATEAYDELVRRHKKLLADSGLDED